MSSLLEFASPFGQFSLKRYPEPVGRGQQQSLRAWDAADEYLLQHCQQLLADNALTPASSVLLLNDNFGALAVALQQFKPHSVSDSYLAQEGCRRNLALNSIDNDAVTMLDSFQMPAIKADLVFIKIPKTSALLEDQLYRLRAVVTENTIIVAAAMVKHVHNNTLKLFEKILGTTTTSLAKKKARLVFCQPKPASWQGQSAYPSVYTLENSDYQISNHANVFSRESLDIGTRLFLKHLPSGFNDKSVIDLGCGNGLLGLLAAEKNPQAQFSFYDESFMALASARDNIQNAFGDSVQAQYIADNCLENTAPASADLVLCNPPFHQENVVGDFIAWQMFVDAKRVLRVNGELWVVGNRHMGYHLKLERLFGRCEVVASDAKFVILKAIKSEKKH